MVAMVTTAMSMSVTMCGMSVTVSMTVSVTMCGMVYSSVIITSSSEDNFFILSYFFHIRCIDISVGTISVYVVVVCGVGMSMTVTCCTMILHNGMTMVMITELDKIIITVIATHWSRFWPETMVFKCTLCVSLFKPSTVTQTTLSAPARPATM